MPDAERGRDGLGGTEGGSAAEKGGSGPPPLTPAVPLLTTKGLVEALATLNAPKGNPETGVKQGQQGGP